jgi:hypothetical protein
LRVADGSSGPVPDFDMSQAHAYVLAKHHVVPGTQTESLDEIARSVCGVHSARLQTPSVVLFSRMEHPDPLKLHRETDQGGGLIKLRCMRRTLHTVPVDLAPMVHTATSAFRLTDSRRRLGQAGVCEELGEWLKERIAELVEVQPLSSERLVTDMCSFAWPTCAGAVDRRAATRAAVKMAWEQGDLCYANLATHWRQERRVYCATRIRHPGLHLNLEDAAAARWDLVHAYFRAFGPATLGDAAWWSGLPIGTVKASVLATSDIVRLRCHEYEEDFYMFEDDMQRMYDFTTPTKSWWAFMAYEDPSLKGYKHTRHRYVRPEHYASLFNQIGEVRPCVLRDGRAVGLWVWDDQEERVRLDAFGGEPSFPAEVIKLAQVLESYLREHP